jgi:hypothetical protein
MIGISFISDLLRAFAFAQATKARRASSSVALAG